MNFYNLITGYTSILTTAIREAGAETVIKATEAANTASNTATNAPAPAGFGSLIPTIAVYAVFLVAIYFFMFRQPRKEQKAKNEMRAALKIGDNVLTSSGFYGKIVDVGADVFVLEFGNSRGVRVPVRKEAIEGIREPNMTQTTETVK